ncbi:protein GAMETE EXPRESSED 2 [Cocos nucifera]|uniref:Protein GAMETE EXPRESSED 2 n=1 Tax=Cocos nucifera TaxID=13894 RepID=A0A8K0N9V1_COCNU|nr:protein GAMETE EXPRESSED 2 [Cocos nucifera]
MSCWISSLILCLLVWIFSSDSSLAEESSYQTGAGGKPPIPSFAFGWLDDKNTFQAGEIATIKIKLLDYSFSDKNFSNHPMNFSLSVSGKKGNSSYVSGVFSYLEGDPAFWNISFIPMWAGKFTAVITEDHLGISDSTLHFSVTAGNDGPSKDYFVLSASYENGSTVNVLDVRYNGWNDVGYVGLEFVPTIAGSFLLHVYADNRTLSGSPLPFMVKPGPLDIAKSVCKWKYGTNYLQIFSKLEIFIHQQDLFGNLVPGFFPFDARVVQKATNLSIPVADLFFQEVAQGIQLLSFIVSEPGEFVLTIFDAKLNTSISNMTYDFTVFIGYCHGSHGFANGSGLAGSRAGILADFTVYLEDMYHNPSPIEAEKLHVQILSKNGTFRVRPVIFPLRNTSEHGPVAGQTFFAGRAAGSHSSLPANEDRIIIGKPTTQASEFNVAYTPKVSGDYEICVFCGNIPLNNGHPYLMKVSPGLVDTSLSSVSRSTPTVKRFVKNEVLVQIMDSFSNPILSQQTKLAFQIDSVNSSSFMKWAFTDNEDGSYSGYYLARVLGAYNICISFEDKNLPPCPFEIHVHEREYFSEVCNDRISVWEDESAAFDVLLNDYVAGGIASIVESSTPFHGSLLQYGQQFRYTPYRGFYGNDSFSYTISDINNNVATGTVFISVLCQPPQFVSVPVCLHVTEDVISSKFGNDNFYGQDIINLYAMNKNGIQDAHVPVFVEPINDPPIINAPKFIFLGKKEATNGLQIFDKQRDAFEFSISDSDIFNFSGNKSHFVFTFSLEVNDGILSTSLPVNLIDTAELMTTSSNQWEPLQTFVTISNHFVLKGKGVRFRGTLGNCNNAMQYLFYEKADYEMPSHLWCEWISTIKVYWSSNYEKKKGCMKALYRERSDRIDDVTTTNEDNIDHQTLRSHGLAYALSPLAFNDLQCHKWARKFWAMDRDVSIEWTDSLASVVFVSHRGFKIEESRKDELSSSQFSDVGRQPIPLHIERQKLRQSD